MGELACRPFVGLFVAQHAANLTLHGTCDNSWLDGYEFCLMPFGDSPYFGVLFDMTCVQRSAVDFDA